jgi:hypothetical protein
MGKISTRVTLQDGVANHLYAANAERTKRMAVPADILPISDAILGRPAQLWLAGRSGVHRGWRVFRRSRCALN